MLNHESRNMISVNHKHDVGTTTPNPKMGLWIGEVDNMRRTLHPFLYVQWGID
jgi:hypothetical protein